MDMQSHPIWVLPIDDDEDDYMVVRDLLLDLSSMEFILEWVSEKSLVSACVLCF
ncbi:MAG: hypothetical protein ABSG35_07915 [Syntrophobacteraceae bacterium]